MRVTSMLLVTVALAGCSQQEPSRSENDYGLMAAEESPSLSLPNVRNDPVPRSPGVNPTNAPGVAFNYRYDFRLEAERIAATQERHAAACEKLGVDRCRITGMQYRLVEGDDVAAMLAFRLEPALARAFGKEGIAAVEQAEGILTASEITGVDEGANIAAASGAEARLTAERERLEARLRAARSPSERGQIESELAEIRRSLEASRAGRAGSERALRGTPMVFNYGSGDVVPGFRGGSRLGEAFATAGETMIGALATLIVVLGALLPLAILAALLMLLWRLLRPTVRKWGDGDAPLTA